MPKYPVGTIKYTVRPVDTLRLIAQRFHTTVYEIATLNPEVYLKPIYAGQVIYIKPSQDYKSLSDIDTVNEYNKTMVNLKEDFRLIWEQHVEWTRSVITSIVFGLPNLESVTNRLLRNPIDMEKAFLPYYGIEAASRLADLMRTHLEIAAQLVKAAKAGNKDAASRAERNWYINADEIAAFLGSINPYWSEEDWKEMLHEHLALTKSEAVYMLNKKYTEDISTYDKIEKQALEMADTMAKGIIKQFPNKF